MHVFTVLGRHSREPQLSLRHPDGGANTPNERSFAYNALSNQLVVVRCPPNSTAYTLWVVDADTGANLHTLNTTGVIAPGTVGGRRLESD